MGKNFNLQRTRSNVKVFHANCVTEKELCKRMAIKGYPSLFVGTREDFIDSFDDENNDRLTKIMSKHDVDYLIEEINKETESIVKNELEESDESEDSEMVEMKYDRVEKYNFVQMDDLIKTVGLIIRYGRDTLETAGDEELVIFEQFVETLSRTFPVKRCIDSLQNLRFQPRKLEVKAKSDDEEKSEDTKEKEDEKPTKRGFEVSTKNYSFCHMTDYNIDNLPWQACAGSDEYHRGYSCGLWSLFHTMLVNGGEFLAIKNYIGTFFQCNPCRLHFLKTTEKYDINNTNNGEQILYMWNVHNLVNLRLRGEEERDGHGDPNYP
eukprot:UN24665